MKHIAQVFSFAVFVFLLSVQPPSAQIAAENLPDMSALRQVFGGVSDGSETVETITDEDGLIGSGIRVPDTGARGMMAREIAQGLGEATGDPAIADTLEPIFAQLVETVESEFPGLGFQKRDFGVSFAFFFLMNWQIANNVDLPEEIYKPVARQLVQTIQASYAKDEVQMSAGELDRQYDLMLTFPLAILAVVQSLEQNGQADDAAAMREVAGQTFEQVLGISPYDIDITEAGIAGYD